MATASLTASLLARKGTARPAPLLPGSFTVYDGSPKESAYPKAATGTLESWENPESRPSKPSRQTAISQVNKNSLKVEQEKTGKTVRKTVTIPAGIDKELRVLAAARGVSQQQVLAEILTDHLHHIYAEEGCICGAKHHR